MIARLFYSLLWYLATPLIRHYLRRRARRAPAYLEHWDERFGKRYEPRKTAPIWVHAVSVGETRAALPLIRALRRRWPLAPLLITQMTPTGRACAQELYADQAEIRYLPYDYPASVREFFAAYQPQFGVLMETELWPNLIHAAQTSGTALFLANARMSEKSYKGYTRFSWLIRPAMQALRAVAAQSEADAARLRALGAEDVGVCGNTKYDFEPPAEQLQSGRIWKLAQAGRQVVVCASTRAGEEELILQAWRRAGLHALLVLVPRHPERFLEVEQQARAAGFCVARRSEQIPPLADTEVWIGDSMGEMFAYYGFADLVFMGGSLMPLGGQNLIEPASAGVPVLMGPSTFNFADASAHAFRAGAARQVADADEMVDCIKQLLQEPEQREQMSAAALGFSQAHRGASERIVEMIAARLSVPPVEENTK